ncbi:MAG: hypothetical protein GXP39_07785 [Chloroflexi bacterium]|nr:hypothetical protein [Chloroflexota bacterium]
MCAEEVKAEAEFDLADWLAEGIRGIRQELKRKPCRLLPEAFWEHTRASQREALLAVRSLFDAAIECLQPAEVESQPSRTRRRRATKIEVQ